MLEISLRQLETFVVTAECGSFTRAAEKLHLTQSTVSTHIQCLEQELRTQLILRGARRRFELIPSAPSKRISCNHLPKLFS